MSLSQHKIHLIKLNEYFKIFDRLLFIARTIRFN